jgi:hypothetical protein
VEDVENLSTGNVDKRVLFDYDVEKVENLSTIFVDKWPPERLLCGRCGKLIHRKCG